MVLIISIRIVNLLDNRLFTSVRWIGRFGKVSFILYIMGLLCIQYMCSKADLKQTKPFDKIMQ